MIWLYYPSNVQVKSIWEYGLLWNSPSGKLRPSLSSIPTTGKIAPGICKMLKRKLKSSSHQRAKNIPWDAKAEAPRACPTLKPARAQRPILQTVFTLSLRQLPVGILTNLTLKRTWEPDTSIKKMLHTVMTCSGFPIPDITGDSTPEKEDEYQSIGVGHGTALLLRAFENSTPLTTEPLPASLPQL